MLGLGSNMGDREGHLVDAVASLAMRSDVRVLARSRLYDTAPLTLPGSAPQPRYLNAAVRVETRLAPLEMLAVCLGIEVALGRVRRERWGPRTIDLDLLVALDASGALMHLAEPSLTLPHPGLEDRVFALAPLLEVAAELAPLYGERLAALTPEAEGASAGSSSAAPVGARWSHPLGS